jgi:hypothetical protein
MTFITLHIGGCPVFVRADQIRTVHQASGPYSGRRPGNGSRATMLNGDEYLFDEEPEDIVKKIQL